MKRGYTIMQTPMDALTQGVYLVGSNNGRRPNMMTAAWVTQISSNALLVAVGYTHYTAELIRQSGHFSLSVLSEAQREIAVRCGTVCGRIVDKSSELPLIFSDHDDPLLSGAVAHFSCRVIHTAEVLDHVLFCGEVMQSTVYAGVPMSYQAEQFF